MKSLIEQSGSANKVQNNLNSISIHFSFILKIQKPPWLLKELWTSGTTFTR